LPNVNAVDELEPPVPANPKALGVVFVDLPKTDCVESPLVPKAVDRLTNEPLAPDGAAKAKGAVGFVCMLVEVDVLVAASSFFSNANGEVEGNEANVVLPVGVGLEGSVVLGGFKLSVAGPDVALVSAAPPNVNVDFDRSTDPPNTGVAFGVSAVRPNANAGFKPSAELPNIEGGVGLRPNRATEFEPPTAPPAKAAGLDPSADLEPGLVPPNEKAGILPEAGVEEVVLSKAVALAGVGVRLGGVDVKESPSTASGLPKKFVTEAGCER